MNSFLRLVKKNVAAIFMLLFALGFSQQGWGQVLTEDFNYTAAQLITANGWTAISAGGNNAITVTSPGLTYT